MRKAERMMEKQERQARKDYKKSQDDALWASGPENEADDQGRQEKGARIEPPFTTILI